MNRERFETYCKDHGWSLFVEHDMAPEAIRREGHSILVAEKDKKKIYRIFEVAMDLGEFLNDLKRYDYDGSEAQIEFKL